MGKFFLITFILLLTTQFIDAQEADTTSTTKLSAKQIKSVLDNIVEKQYFNDEDDEKPLYNLLWKISGNGLSKPSYLFGTMHVRNYRAFNFPKELYDAIEDVDAFSMEFHPDSMISGALSHCYFDDSYFSKKEILTYKENETPGLGFTEPRSLEGMLNRDGYYSGKKTFVDAYLYDMARMRGKNIHGLEELADYYKIENKNMGLSKDFLLQTHNKYDLLSIYHEGNIDSIYNYMAMVHDTTSRRFITLLIDRNRSMAERMHELIQKEAVFNTMGSAHLGGDRGVVNLLRQMGYTLEAVKPTFDYEEVETEEVIPDGFTFNNHRDGYKVVYPSSPFIPNLDSLQFAKYTYGDIGRNSFYESYCLDFTDYDSLTFKMVERKVVISLLKQDYDNEIDTSYLVDHASGLYSREFIISSGTYNSSSYYRLRIFQDDRRAYVLLYKSLKEDLNFQEANRFFDSFEVIPVTERSRKKAYTYVNTTGAYKVIFPETFAEFKLEEDFYDEDLIVNIHYSGFINDLSDRKYLVRYQDAPPGRYISNDSLIYGEIVDQLKRQYGRLKSVEKISKDGVEGIRVELKRKRKSSYAEIFTRGSRSYVVLVVHEKEDKRALAFLDSFRLLPLQKQEYREYTGANEVFTAKFPSQKVYVDTIISSLPHSMKQLVRFGVTDSLTGQTSALLQYEISPYAQIEDIDDLLSQFMEEQDFEKIIESKQEKGYLYKKTQSSSGRVVTELEFRQLGNYVLGKLASYPNEAIPLENKDLFFNSVQLKKHDANFDLSSSKKTLVLEHLASEDSLKQVEALAFLNYYTYSSADLDPLFKAIKSPFFDDRDSLKNRKTSIIAKLSAFEDERVSSFLLSSLKDTLCVNCQVAILDAILKSENPQKYDVLFETLQSPDFRVSNPKTLSEALSVFAESIDLTSKYMDELWMLNRQNSYDFNLTDILKDHILNGNAKKLKLNDHKDEIVALAQKYCVIEDTLANSKELSNETVKNITVLLGELSDDKSMTYLKSLELASNYTVRKFAVLGLLKRGAEVQQNVIDSLLMEDSERLSTFLLLKKLKREDLINTDYTQPYLLAQSQMYMMYSEAADLNSYDQPDTLAFLGEGNYDMKGVNYTYYIFRMYTANSKRDSKRYLSVGNLPKYGGYIGVSGLHPEKGFDSKAKFTTTDWTHYDRYTYYRDAKRMLNTAVRKNKYKD